MGSRRGYIDAVLGALVLMAAAAAATGSQTTATTDITGMYFCQGTNSDGTAYHGVVTIASRAGACYVLWELQPAVTVLGVGIREGDYRIDGDRLVGRWTVPGANGLSVMSNSSMLRA